MNEYRFVFEGNDGSFHDFTVQAPDKYIARDAGEAIMDAEGIEGEIIEVTEV